VGVLGLLTLLALVAVASTGSTPGGRGGAQRPSEWALDVVASLALVILLPGSFLLVFVILLRPESFFHAASRRERRHGRAPSIVGLGLAVVLIVLAVRRLTGGGDGPGGDPSGSLTGGQGGRVPAREDAYEPSFALVPVIVTLAVLAIGAVAAIVAFRSRRSEDGSETHDVSAALGDLLDDALDDLRAEADARRAVIAAYARLERVLAAYGLPRRPSEAPEEYLQRVLPTLEVSRHAVSRLTALFETAKFSQHAVGATMKEEAVEALEAARDELRLAAARERAAREEALAVAAERAAG
jgi:hypothetical protein